MTEQLTPCVKRVAGLDTRRVELEIEDYGYANLELDSREDYNLLHQLLDVAEESHE